MAENDSMEGKKLEIEMFEQKILDAIQTAEEQKQDTATIENGAVAYEIKIEKIDKKIKIHAFGEEILTLEEDKFTYNLEGLKNIQEKLKDNPEFDYKQFGLPDVEYLEELERQEEQEKEENQKDEKDLSDDLEEKEEDEPEEKEKTEDELKNQFAKKHNVSPNQIIHVSMNRRITDHDNFKGLAKWAKDYKDVYILPGKDEYSWETVGVNKDGKEETIENKQQEGRNPNVRIKLVDKDQIKEVRPIAMYEIDNKTSYAIIRDGSGKTQMLYCRQEAGKGKEYWGIGVPEAEGKNVPQKSAESRDFIDSRNNSSYDLSKKADELVKGKDLEERGIPSKGGKGVQVEEIEGTATQNRMLRKEDILEDLLRRDGIIDRATAMPGFYENKAEKVLRLMESDDKITYEQAVEKVERQEKGNREEGGRTPDQNSRKRDH